MADEKPDYTLSTIIFGNGDPLFEASDDCPLIARESDEAPDPLGKFFEDRAEEVAKKKAGITVHAAEPIAKPEDFEKHSDSRFEKVCEVIQRVFKNHPSEAAEAVEVARRMRTEARAEVIIDAE